MQTVYLCGEIHSDWRQRIIDLSLEAGLGLEFLSPETDHGMSDRIGAEILGEEPNQWNYDQKSAKINAIRIRCNLEIADLVVVKFGEQYKQWNTAFEAGMAFALGKPLIVLHDEQFTHALKDIDAAAQAWCTQPEQVAEILKYLSR